MESWSTASEALAQGTSQVHCQAELMKKYEARHVGGASLSTGPNVGKL
ncbi:hypothetical protein ES703_99467 [subsurface metagenome]